jgi:REP element-mobilizing transposase RayT
LPKRKRLYHHPPPWVEADALYFVTVCCLARGEATLNRTTLFAPMIQALEYYIHSGRWRAELFLAMPDHWHALIRFADPDKIERTLRDWKRFVAKQSGIRWQDGFFEHRIRTPQSAEEKWH